MSTLIKSTDKAHGLTIQRLASKVAIPAATERVTLVKEDPLAEENKRLIALLEKRETEIATQKDAITRAFAEGEQSGRIAVEAEMVDDRAASLALLGEGIDAAKAELRHALENAESVALMVAQMALDKMFGDAKLRKSSAVDLIRYQFRQIDHDSFVALEVSREDFPNTNEVAELAMTLSISPDRVRVSDNLAAGDCHMRMQLGTLDIGLDRQWDSIRSLLTDMATVCEVEYVK